ncbi:uncharacterized protein LOC134163000 isoform X2 [Pezoporus occidentalis]|uniref:uncharacterized protein LOC134163000 isoform X2 n=1 Tax=Pezoporus occidentalis TaxID=407982 RepID=UPI002F90BBA6
MGKGVCMYSVFLCWTRGERRCLRASASKGESKGCSSASSPLSQALLMLWLFSGRAKSKAAGQTPCHTFTRGPDFGHGRTTCCVARRRGAEPEVLICSTSLLSGSSESWSSSLGEELLAVLKGVDRKCSSWALPWQLCCQEQVSKTVAFVPGSGNPAGLLETWLIDRHRTPSFFRQKMAVHKKRFLRFIVFLLPVVLGSDRGSRSRNKDAEEFARLVDRANPKVAASAGGGGSAGGGDKPFEEGNPAFWRRRLGWAEALRKHYLGLVVGSAC